MRRDQREVLADWLIVVGGVVLFASLFLTWSHQFSPAFEDRWGAADLLRGAPRHASAWQVYAAEDVVLAMLAVGLVAVALVGGRVVRIVMVAAVGLAIAFTLHARSAPPTNGATVVQTAIGPASYVPTLPRSGPGETVAAVALAVGLAGLGLSFTAD